MESNHLTTRTYTAHTCELIVSTQSERQLGSGSGQSSRPVDFTLHLDRSELGELDRVTIQGQPPQLEYLHQIVSKYIVELVAKFPLPTTTPQLPSLSDRSPQDPQSSSDLSSARSGIIKNLPGLRQPPSPPTNPISQPSFDAKPSISKLLGRGQVPQDRNLEPHDSSDLSTAALPYLIGGGDRDLDHQFHLGTLSKPTGGEVLTLSAIQLFDLAAVLDEYATEHIANRPNILSRASIPSTTANPRSGLPNLPNIPAESATSQVYYRTRRSRSSFRSGIPWAIAAAILVGVPLLLLDPHSNPLKDAASKLKMPDLSGIKKAATPNATGKKETTTTSTSPNSTAALPTPWQTQSVQPPQTITKPTSPSGTTTPDPSKIGTATLPESISGKSGGDVPTPTTSIAPNPLATTPVPADLNKSSFGSGSPTTTATANNSSPKPTGVTAAPGNRATPLPSTTSSQKKIAIGQLPIDGDNSGKMSVSKQPISIPPSAVAPSVANPAGTSNVPFDLPSMGSPQPSNSTTTTPKKSKPTASKVKPTPGVSNPGNSNNTGASPSPKFEPVTPIVKNPNLIDPNQSNNESSEPQPPQVVPNQPLQSNSGADIDAANNPSLEETKRYFQSKWKANPAQPNALQYVLQVTGKSGVVRSVSPQGEAATTYLQQTKLIKPGQKLVSPVAAGNSDRKIRVLLQPDGGVDTFIEP
jgi:Domain of unknown function (DUF4335)